jgi:hypothetical protein
MNADVSALDQIAVAYDPHGVDRMRGCLRAPTPSSIEKLPCPKVMRPRTENRLTDRRRTLLHQIAAAPSLARQYASRSFNAASRT